MSTLAHAMRRTLSRASSTWSSSSTSPTHLSPEIKALLASAAAAPKPVPSPGAALSPLFHSLRAAERHGLEPRVWLTLGTAAICTINSPDSLVALYEFAAGASNVEGKAGVVRVMRETGLKCISFNGIPRTINNLGALRAHLDADVVAALPTQPARTVSSSNIDATLSRGRGLWDGIYRPYHDKLLAKLGDSHPDLPVHILSSHYSPLLSDPPGHGPIGRVLTSVIAITCLRAQTGVGPQVKSHVHGLMKSLDDAADGDAVQGQEWLVSDEGVRWVLETTDEMSAVIAQGRAFGGARS